MVKKVFPAHLDHLYPMLDLVREEAVKVGFEQDIIAKIVLATEEALVNVIKHGYQNQGGEIELTCHKPSSFPGIEIVIKDYGVPFNPIENSGQMEDKSHQLLNQSIDNVVIGGYGIYIYVGIMDRVKYERINNGNLLSLSKYL